MRTNSIKLLLAVLALAPFAERTHGQSVSASPASAACPSVKVSYATTFLSDPLTRCLDEYGDISITDEKPRLDNFGIELQENPTATGYILCYAGRVTRAGAAQTRCLRAKNFLVESRGFAPDRIVTIDGGHREQLTVQLCVVPQGSAPPTPSPTVEPHDVKIIRPKPARSRRRARTR